MFEQGDLVLIPVPFTDLSSLKRRPVIVISNNDYNRSTSDVVVVAMTSNPEVTRYSFRIVASDVSSQKVGAAGVADPLKAGSQAVCDRRHPGLLKGYHQTW